MHFHFVFWSSWRSWFGGGGCHIQTRLETTERFQFSCFLRREYVRKTHTPQEGCSLDFRLVSELCGKTCYLTGIWRKMAECSVRLPLWFQQGEETAVRNVRKVLAAVKVIFNKAWQQLMRPPPPQINFKKTLSYPIQLFLLHYSTVKLMCSNSSSADLFIHLFKIFSI